MTSTAGPGRHGDRAVLTVRSAYELAAARTSIADRAIAVGIERERAGRIALAANEVATNALVHAASPAYVEIILTYTWFVVEISDHGPGLSAPVVNEAPALGQARGRGLWLAEQLCDRVEVASSVLGTRVSLYLHR